MKNPLIALVAAALLPSAPAHALSQGINKWETPNGKLVLVLGTYEDQIKYHRNFTFYFQNGESDDWHQVPIMEKKGIPSIGWDSASHDEITLADGTVVQRADGVYFVTASKRAGKGSYFDPGDVTVTWYQLLDAGDNDHDGAAQQFSPTSTRIIRAVPNGVDDIIAKESKLPLVQKQSAEILGFKKITPLGKVISVTRVVEKTDEKILVLTEKPTKSANGRIERIDLNATYYGKAGQQWKSDWAINDFVNCPGLDSKASFFPDATTITDIDADGKPEITIAYQLFCGGGVEPSTVKVILRQGDTKYAIRGETMIRLPGQAAIGGNRTPDPGLLQPANVAFLKHLESVWNGVYVEKR
ncbi:hypothetical protein GM658_07830 [Pseudoduganella eburnea]|uniref:Uncharacterized protein n=1 Tax=Massilia eburnea TaxID=1776165 RepID=A0A6L6QDQ3_9BURK|nr:hypothetical protein [Massilia eburnea]MTW10512.1 hypothetical protein [Massilia eburnea]